MYQMLWNKQNKKYFYELRIDPSKNLELAETFGSDSGFKIKIKKCERTKDQNQVKQFEPKTGKVCR